MSFVKWLSPQWAFIKFRTVYHTVRHKRRSNRCREWPVLTPLTAVTRAHTAPPEPDRWRPVTVGCAWTCPPQGPPGARDPQWLRVPDPDPDPNPTRSRLLRTVRPLKQPPGGHSGSRATHDAARGSADRTPAGAHRRPDVAGQVGSTTLMAWPWGQGWPRSGC